MVAFPARAWRRPAAWPVPLSVATIEPGCAISLRTIHKLTVFVQIGLNTPAISWMRLFRTSALTPRLGPQHTVSTLQPCKRPTRQFYTYLHGHLTNQDLEDFAGPDRGKFSMGCLFNQFPAAAEWFRFKAALSVDLFRDWHAAIAEFGGPDKELAANAFMPPFSYLTGFDFAGAAQVCTAIAPKLYTMHWSLIVQFWGDVLLTHNPNLDEGLLVKALVNLWI